MSSFADEMRWTGSSFEAGGSLSSAADRLGIEICHASGINIWSAQNRSNKYTCTRLRTRFHTYTSSVDPMICFENSNCIKSIIVAARRSLPRRLVTRVSLSHPKLQYPRNIKKGTRKNLSHLKHRSQSTINTLQPPSFLLQLVSQPSILPSSFGFVRTLYSSVLPSFQRSKVGF